MTSDLSLEPDRPTCHPSGSPAAVPEGDASAVQSKRVLVTGCGRSGTTYVSVLLRKCGVDVPHEHHMGRDGISSWLFATRSRAVPWGPTPSGFRFDNVVHLVRDPLAAIPSIATFKESAWAFIERHIPLDPGASVLGRSAMYWLLWNQMIEERAHSRLRVEDMPGAIRPLCTRIGAPIDVAAVPSMRRNLNTRRYGRLFASLEDRCLRLGLVPTCIGSLLARLPQSYRDLSWSQLRGLDPCLTENIHRKALEYGYRYDD